MTKVAFACILSVLVLAGCTELGGLSQVGKMLAEAQHQVVAGTRFTSVAPSDLFCGNLFSGKGNGVPGSCRNNERVTDHTITPRLVEVRGWVLHAPGPTDGREEDREEFAMDLLLDASWTPHPDLPSHIDAINTPGEVNRLLSPHNVIAFGERSASQGNPQMDDDAQFFGGFPVIHVEINGVDPRGRAAGETGAGGAASAQRLSDWRPAFQGGEVLWSWPPEHGRVVDDQGSATRALVKGDYVRVVGLAWEDNGHNDDWCLNMLGSNCPQNKTIQDKGGPEGYDDREDCWNDGKTSGHGWVEIHPPDLIAILDENALSILGDPSLKLRTMGLGQAIVTGCDEHFDAGLQFDLFPAYDPPNNPLERLECAVDRNPMFTEADSVTTETITKINSPRPGCHIRIDLDDGVFTDAKYQAFFTARWKE